jgi:hypothetical protein
VLDEATIIADLLTRSEAEVIEIRAQARECVYSHATSISGLSQSIQFDKESAEIVMKLANEDLARRRRDEGATATDPLSMRGTLGHSMRFGGRWMLAP